jgi:ribulose-phosphate 3-epimerase
MNKKAQNSGKILVAPSILAADFGQLNEDIAAVEPFADMLHVDLMDHHFVPNLTFGAPVIRCIKTKLPMDCHLMVEHPEEYLVELAEIGVASVTVHAESTPHLHRVLMKVRELGMKPAVAINPGTSLSAIEEVLPMVEMVLVMSVNPGFGGQKFLDLALGKIKKLRADWPDLLIQADGGINAETAALCREAGANVLVAGSYIFKATDKKAAVKSLRG